MKKKIAVHIQSEVQFFSLEPLLNSLKNGPYCLDIIVDDQTEDTRGFKEMASGVQKMLVKAGFKPIKINCLDGKIYDICLTAYFDESIKANCYLKYEYGTLNIKPNLTYTPEMLEGFHGFLCQSKITNELLKVYGDTFPVENLRFYNKTAKLNRHHKKKKVLFAPTYNDKEDIKDLKKVIETLKTKYYVIIKGHHGTSYLKENSRKKDIFMELADEYYDSNVSLSDLILQSDVCLFGNSSAIGEALYVGVPCAIFAKDVDYFKLGDIHTTQHQLVEAKIIPWTDKAEEVLEIMDEAMSDNSRKAQKNAALELFPKEYKTGVDGYIKVIDYFLNNETAKDYVMLHDYAVKKRRLEFRMEKRNNEKLQKEIYELNQKLAAAEAKIMDDSKKKLYRLADKIYKLEGRIINVES